MTEKKEVTAVAYMNCLDEVLRVRAERDQARKAVDDLLDSLAACEKAMRRHWEPDLLSDDPGCSAMIRARYLLTKARGKVAMTFTGTVCD